MMTEEDEDIIFDQAALLPGDRSDDDVIPLTPNGSRSQGRVFITVCLCLAFFALGLCIAIPGPTLLDLQDQTNTDTEQISRIFTGRSVGYLVGSIIGGFLFDRLNQSCLLSFSLFLTAVATAAAPWCKNIVLLMAILALQGVSMGFLDTGGNVLCLHTWGRNSGPYIQAMHCLFGVGAFVAPLIAEPFLSHRINATNTTLVMDSTTALLPLDKRDIHVWIDSLQPLERGRRDVGVNDTLTAVSTLAPKPTKPKVADAIHLNADRKFADGSQLSHDLKKMEKQQQQQLTSTKLPTLTPPVLPGSELNKTWQESSKGSSSLAASTTTTARTTMVTTSPTTTTTVASTTTTTVFSTNHPKLSENQTNSANTNKSQDQSTLDNLKQKVTSIITVIHSFSKVQFAYLVIAGTVMFVSFLFMIACCRDGRHVHVTRSQDSDPAYGVQTESTGFRVQILILLFVFFFLYVGMEVTFGGLAMTFSVMFLGWSKAEGSLLTSTFWGAIAGGRAIAVFLARCLTPPIMLIVDLIVVIFALTGLVMASESSSILVWVCSAMLGIGMASIFPTGITWAERYMHITGKFTSVFVVGSALGEMLMPALAGFLFEAKGPMWLLYILLASSVFSIIIYIIMQNLATNMGERYNRLNNIPHTAYYSPNANGIDADLEMNTLMPTSTTYSDDWSLQRRKKVTFNLNGIHVDGEQRNGDLASEADISVNNGQTEPKHSILKGKATTKAG